MNSYTGLHASLYDEIYASKPYADEARFIHDLIGRPGGKLLDVACGTGRHALAFAELGYEVVGVDINEELLEIARRVAGPRVRFVQGDMRDLRVQGAPFDVVTCLFDSIGYAGDDEGIISALRSLGTHCAPGGRIVCEFLHAAAILCNASRIRVGRWTLDDGRFVLRTSSTDLDVEQMLMNVTYDLVVLDPEGRAERASELQTNRFFSVPEMNRLAAAASLATRSIVSAYREGPIDTETFHLLLVASPRE